MRELTLRSVVQAFPHVYVEAGRSGAVFHVQLFQDIFDVFAHRSFADLKDLRNAFIAFAFGEPVEYIHFALG